MVGNAVGLSVGYGVANDGVGVGDGVGSTAETPPTASEPAEGAHMTLCRYDGYRESKGRAGAHRAS